LLTLGPDPDRSGAVAGPRHPERAGMFQKQPIDNALLAALGIGLGLGLIIGFLIRGSEAD